MKKILVVFHDPDSRSGATASMLSIIEALNRVNNIFVDALIPQRSGDLKAKIERIGVRCYTGKYYTARYFCDTNIFGLISRYIKTIAKNFLALYSAFKFSKKSNRYDLIYTNTSDIYIGFFLSLITKTKHIWHIREFGLEDQDCKHICSDGLFYKIASKRSSAVIVISESLFKKVVKYVDGNKVHTIYNDIMCINSDYKKDKWKKDITLYNKLRLIIVGKVSPGKGQVDVIKAVFDLKLLGIDFHLGIVGHDDSKYANDLKNRVKEMGLESHIKFLGYRKDMDTIRADYDIGIVASVSEAFGRVTTEGMLSGLVMIGSNRGANPELINHDESGFLYEKNDYSDLVRVLIHISENRKDMDRIRGNAYMFAKTFTVGRAGNQIAELILSQ